MNSHIMSSLEPTSTSTSTCNEASYRYFCLISVFNQSIPKKYFFFEVLTISAKIEILLKKCRKYKKKKIKKFEDSKHHFKMNVKQNKIELYVIVKVAN